MHFCTAEHFPLENVMQKCIFAQLDIFLWKMYAKMHFGIKCICNILCYKMYASNAFCRFLTFCKQNVRVASNAFLHQMHFCTASLFFAKQKTQHFCTALLNIFLWKMFSKTKCYKCILAKQRKAKKQKKRSKYKKCIFCSQHFGTKKQIL